MKQRFLLIGLCLYSSASVFGQTASAWINNSSIICPPDIAPQVDAISFINNRFAVLSISFTNGDYLPVFDTTSTLNFTNHGFMSANTGFRFDTEPVEAGFARWAANFHNTGVIESGLANNSTFLFLGTPGGARTFVGATNIVSPGTFNMGFESLLNIAGGSVDLSRGTITSETTGFSVGIFTNRIFIFFSQGFLDGYWATNEARINPAQFGASPAFSPALFVRDRSYNFRIQQLGGPSFLTYLSDVIDASGSNRFVRAVFLNNTNSSFNVNVFLPGPPFFGNDIEVEWIGKATNILGEVRTNFIYLFDSFGATTNFQLIPNGTAGPRVTYIPENYTFILGRQLTLGIPEVPTTIPPGTFISGILTNQETAYEALFYPSTSVVGDLAEQNITNLPGRVIITGSDYLDLKLSRVTALNYMLLSATNHYGGNEGAALSSPFMDVFLRSTNGMLTITNLIQPIVPRPEGTIELYSARWTNVVGGITNQFHVLFVDSRLSPTFPPRLQDAVFRTTTPSGGPDSLIINDVISILRSAVFDTASITIATNGPDAATPTGGINFLDDTVWSTATPRLQHLTNSGFINAANAVYFGGGRTSPSYNSTFDEPYIDFINTGGVTNFGSQIWALNFLNSGNFFAETGAIELHQARTAVLTNGSFVAPAGDISIESSMLQVSNHALLAGGALSLAVTNYLDDGSLSTGSADLVTNRNFWVSGFGFNLLSRLQHASLLATTVTNNALPFQRVVNRWAAADRGANPQSFVDNAAVGDLILSGGTNSQFEFAPVLSGSALYVDRLELNGPVGISDRQGHFSGIRVDPGMRVYYGEALANGVDISEKLSGTSGLVWVSNYNCGLFSSTNLIYPDGTTNRVNRALAGSCDIDSNGNGIMNCNDPAPIPVGLTGCHLSSPPIPPPAPNTSGSGGGNGSSGSGSSGRPVPSLGYPGQISVAGTVSNDLASATSVYSGMFYETNGVTIASCGYVSASVTAKGSYSARLALAGRTYSFSGKLDAAGNATAAVARSGAAPLTIHLRLDVASGNQIQGTVTSSGWTADLLADRQVYSKRNPAPQAGNYTLLIPGVLPGTTAPGGDGIGTVKVDVSGNVQFSGTLADGTRITQKSTLSKQGIWPFYTALYGGRGVVASWMQFGTNAELAGQLLWLKSVGASVKSYPGGFTNSVEAAGSRYNQTKSGTYPPTAGNAQLILQGGGLNQPLTNAVIMTLDGKVSASASSKLKLNLNRSTGLFQGTALHPQTQKTLSFQGVLLPTSDFGAGFFLNNNLSGEIYLSPAP